jgi:HEAT repeat protein
MNTMCNRKIVGALALILISAALPVLGDSPAPPAQPKMDKGEEQVIANLSSPNESKVIDALKDIENKYSKSTNAFPKMRELLADTRENVRRKSARVLGILHADVTEADIQNIAMLLKSPEPRVIIDGLKALRGLKAPSAVPEIVPLLKFPQSNVKRDACRTLAVLANKDVIPQIEPLLNDPEKDVKIDAQAAIDTLQKK